MCVDELSGINLLQVAVSDGDYDTVLKASALLDDFVKEMKIEKTTFKANVFPGKSPAEIQWERRPDKDITDLYDKMVEVDLSLNKLHHSARKD